MANESQTVTIDGKEYKFDELPEEVRNQLTNLRHTEAEIQRLSVQMAIAKTARATYLRALSEEMSKTTAAASSAGDATH